MNRRFTRKFSVLGGGGLLAVGLVSAASAANAAAAPTPTW